ncbi:META domain-containing protein [uncultured Psychrobacter sp.]|uniref:META domain-containing protein n=1 Tax=uncultured Psychrobacter sp. TaxID=259303 RepID=UPI003457BE5F
MSLNRLVSPFLIISLLSSIVLLGCQSTSTANSQQSTTVSIISTKEQSNTTDETAMKKALPSLPITNELLEQYHWQLVSAVSNTYDDNGRLIRASVGNFYHPDYPISVNFGSYPDNSQYASFSSDCNGSGAPYLLLKDHTLKVGSIVSTDMGCSETSNRIESALFNLMGDSSSKLTLSLQPSQLTSETPADFPRYNLLQTMESGETLVWQNETKTIR